MAVKKAIDALTKGRDGHVPHCMSLPKSIGY